MFVQSAAQVATDANLLQAFGVVLLTGNTGMLVKLIFAAGKMTQQVEDHERRLGVLEDGTTGKRN